ncbi:unnamed protein product [Brassicogethes aeneus]|uniref:Serpin domain-containing protein n=1 Tax=Brassicogethes aeneus TaxID=1431903 RepID=A0A9P0F9K2_BRAAE|nr:unnamed protein product [Brassicogethes aeneus]
MLLKLLLLFSTMALILCKINAQTELADGNGIFSTNIFKVLNNQDKNNFLVSPFSIQVVLALTSEGTKGETFDQLTSAVGIPKNMSTRHREYKILLKSLNINLEVLKLLSANTIYVQDQNPLKEEYQDIARQVYFADIQNINFTDKTYAVNVINKWVEEHTYDKIQNLISPNNLNALTSVILVNTLYFLGKWAQPFKVGKTRIGGFTTMSGSVVQVPFMKHVGKFKYKETERAQFIRLPYIQENNTNVFMVVILPKTDLDSIDVSAIFQRGIFSEEVVKVILPKFSMETSTELRPILQELGVKDLFEQKSADLSGMAGEKGQLVVTNLVQKTFINVTEVGTEAGAATAVIVASKGIFLPSITFNANRTFMYYIEVNNVILFSGRVSDPSQ